MDELEKLSLDALMSLYREKISAEKSGDRKALMILEMQYPDLFSPEFDDFISDVRETIEYLRNKYGEDFRGMLEPAELTHH